MRNEKNSWHGLNAIKIEFIIFQIIGVLHFTPEKLQRKMPCDDETAADLILGVVDRLQSNGSEQAEGAPAVSAWRLRTR